MTKINKRNLIVYVAGKYTDKDLKSMKNNTKLAIEYTAKIWDMGYTVICPHGNVGLELNKHIKNTNYEDIMKGSFELLSRSDILFLLPNWKDSAGSKREYAYAKKHGITVVTDLDLLNLIAEMLVERYKNGEEN